MTFYISDADFNLKCSQLRCGENYERCNGCDEFESFDENKKVDKVLNKHNSIIYKRFSLIEME